jgi:hypothetical protein
MQDDVDKEEEDLDLPLCDQNHVMTKLVELPVTHFCSVCRTVF